ncbi:MAG: hypothetical protein R3D33_15730 [Hyphomicrobiaceae bacterium]
MTEVEMRTVAVLPVLSLMPLALIAAAPLSAPGGAESMLPMLPLLGIHFWSSRRPEMMPALFVFGLGLLFDLVTDGPVGYWAMLNLIAGSMGGLSARLREAAMGPAARVVLFSATVVVITIIAWLIASLYMLAPQPLLPMLWGALFAFICYLPMRVMLGQIDIIVSGRPQERSGSA